MNIMYALGFVHAMRNQPYDPLWNSIVYDIGYAAGQHEYLLERKLK